MTSAYRGDEPPPTYSFSVALSIFAAIMWFFSMWVLIGVWEASAIIAVVLQIVCLVGLVIAIRHLIAKKKIALISVPAAAGALWFVTLLEGAIVWGDVLYFGWQMTDEPLYGAQLAALLLAAVVIVLVFLPKTRAVLTNGTIVGPEPTPEPEAEHWAPPAPQPQTDQQPQPGQWARPPAPQPEPRPGQWGRPPAPQPRPPFGPQGHGPRQQ